MAKQIKRKDIPLERRKEIMNAAAELFAHKGYYGVSVNAIAQKAGVSKGNLYWHFESKLDIFHQLFEYLAAPLFIPLIEILESDLPPRKKLKSLSKACIDAAEKNPEVIRVGWQIVTHPELQEIIQTETREYMAPFIARLIPLFEAIGEKKPEAVARFYALTLDAFMGVSVLMPDEFDKKRFLSIIDERIINYTGGNDD